MGRWVLTVMWEMCLQSPYLNGDSYLICLDPCWVYFPRKEVHLKVLLITGPILDQCSWIFQPYCKQSTCNLVRTGFKCRCFEKGETHFSFFYNLKKERYLLSFFLMNSGHNWKLTNLSPWEMASGKWDLIYIDLWDLQKQSTDWPLPFAEEIWAGNSGGISQISVPSRCSEFVPLFFFLRGIGKLPIWTFVSDN